MQLLGVCVITKAYIFMPTRYRSNPYLYACFIFRFTLGVWTQTDNDNDNDPTEALTVVYSQIKMSPVFYMQIITKKYCGILLIRNLLNCMH